MRYFIIVFLFVLFSSNACLEMHVHDVGQGNAVFLKNHTKAIIVDCGSSMVGKYTPKESVFEPSGYGRPIVNYLR